MNKSHLLLITSIFIGCNDLAMPPQLERKPSLRIYPYKTASVLPFTYLIKDGKPVRYILLAQEANPRKNDEFDDFGGRRDENDEHPKQTAAREFFEEAILGATLGWSLPETEKYIDLKSKHTKTIIATQNRVVYLTFLRPTDFAFLKHKFQRALAAQTSKIYREKKQLATVRWDVFARAIQNAQKNKGISVSALLVDPETGKDLSTESIIRLRPALVKKMRPFVNGEKFQEGKKPEIRFY